MNRLTCATLAFLLLASAAHAQAFGIYKGMPRSELKILGTSYFSDDLLDVEVPDPNPMFDRYYVVATEKYGVCSISARHTKGEKPFPVDDLIHLVEEKYGPRESDLFQSSPLVFKHNLPTDVEQVRLFIRPDYEYDVELSYEFTGGDICAGYVQDVPMSDKGL